MNKLTSALKLLSTGACICMASCGGGSFSSPEDDPSPANIAFQFSYFDPPIGLFANSILVRPVPPALTLATRGVAKVELLLYGHDAQTLVQSNTGAKVPPEFRYRFDLPDDFTTGFYPCGTGKFLSEIRVTDAAGQVLSQTFELCPGEPAEFPPVHSSP